MVIKQEQQICDRIYARIIADEILLGQRVSEKALAREFGCSIIPIREALSRLISMGFLEKISHHDTFARQLSPREMMTYADCRLMICFIPAIDALNSAGSRSLHYKQHQRTFFNVMQRLAEAGIDFPISLHMSPQLERVTFTFSTPST